MNEKKIQPSLTLDNFNFLVLLLELATQSGIALSLKDYLMILQSNSSFENKSSLFKQYSHLYDEQKAYMLLQSEGISEAIIQEITDLHRLFESYDSGLLHSFEKQILDHHPHLEPELLLSLESGAYQNPCGYNALHLALIADNAALAWQLIEQGVDIYTPSTKGTTPLMLYCHKEDYSNDLHHQALAHNITSNIKDVDERIDNRGTNLADLLFENYRLQPLLLEKTTDPLFSFYKKESNLLELSHTPEITRIAISTGETLWSADIWGTARLLSDKHPNVTFHLVTKDMAEQGGDPFLKQFDAIINPGSGDSYPQDLPVFNKKDCRFYFELEQHYQSMVDASYRLGIPYLGICAGNQHLGLYHDASVMPVQGYYGASHQVSFQKGTLAHFQCLNKVEQASVLASGEFPEVSFQGITAHNYAIVDPEPNTKLLMGALSEEGVLMSCVHENGIHYGIQFHPEHFYHLENDGAHVYEQNWFNNFIDIANMHRDHRLGLSIDPAEYYQTLQEHLQQLAHQAPDSPLDSGYASVDDLLSDICLEEPSEQAADTLFASFQEHQNTGPRTFGQIIEDSLSSYYYTMEDPFLL